MAFPVTTIPPSSGGGGGSSDFGDITGWPGASTDFVRGDGSDAPLSAAEIPDLDTAKITTGQFVDGRMPTASNAATIGAISTVANAALPKAGGVMSGDILNSSAIRIGPNTSDGADNGATTFGHSGGSRGGGMTFYGNEHANAGQTRVVIGSGSTFRVYGADGTSLLFYVDSNTGGTVNSYGFSTGPITFTGGNTISGGSMGRNNFGHIEISSADALIFSPVSNIYANKPLVFQNTQTFPGGTLSCFWRTFDGAVNVNGQSGTNFNIFGNGSAVGSVGSNGYQMFGTQSSAGASITSIRRGSSGEIVANCGGGGWWQIDINNSQQYAFYNNGITFTANQSDPGSANNLFRNSSGMHLRSADSAYTEVGTSGGANMHVCGQSEGTKPCSFTFKSPGKAFTNNGTWTNFYSLAEGTHCGEFRVYTTLYGNYYEIGIWTTTIAQIYNGWTVGDIGSPAAGNISFRISGGWLQINVGTSIGAGGYYHAEFHGNVR